MSLILKCDIFQDGYNESPLATSMPQDKTSSFSYTVKTQKTINQAVEDITSGLKEIGFGVIGTLNFKELLQKKGVDLVDEYRLLEVCNPSAAKQALELNPEIGLLLPCPIAVYQKDKENFISLAKPTSLLANLSDRQLDELGKEIEQKLVQVIQKVK